MIEGPKITFPYIDKSFGEYFFEQADKFHNRVFQIDADSDVEETYGDVKYKSVKLALYLNNIGFQENDVVMICCENNLINIIPVFATLFLGGCVSSVDPKLTANDTRHLINLVKPKFFFIQDNFEDLIKDSLRGTSCDPKLIKLNSEIFEYDTSNKDIDSFKPAKKNIYNTAFIVFSSGTTSLPKGICMSHFGALHGMTTVARDMDNINPQKVTHLASTYWISSILITGSMLTVGGGKVIAPSFSGIKFLKAVEKHKITYLFTSSTFTYEITKLDKEIINNYDLSSLHSVTIGGSVLSPKQLLLLRETLPETKFTVGYGSSEAGGFITNFDLRDKKAYNEKLTSSGKPVKGSKIKILDLTSGKLLGPNLVGEILIKTPYQMVGYYNFQKPDTFDADEFIKTGDIGYYDKDEYVYVIDRINETFKFRGNQVSPSAIELILLEHPAVQQAVVFGIPHDVDRFHPAACVILKHSADPTKLVVNEIIEFVSEKVADKNKLRGGLLIVDSFPKTATGKISRRFIRDYFINSVNSNAGS